MTVDEMNSSLLTRDSLKWRSVVEILWYLLILCDCYNLDVEHPLVFHGPNGSLFGYSVLLHQHAEDSWLIVGAPVADSSFYPHTKNPGAIYNCSVWSSQCEQLPVGGVRHCGRHCLAENDNQWLGVSLSRQPSKGHVLACGHRWKNVYYSSRDNQNKLPHGVCFRLSPDLKHASHIIPCYKDHQRKFGEGYGSCQAGISNLFTEDLMVMGAPGTSYWTGSVLVYNTTSNISAAYVDDDSEVLYGSYLGYAVSAGHFLDPQSTEIVGGAPQHEQTGKAYIFRIEGNTLKILAKTKGKELGSYYGASVCAVDLNADGLSDLLVGAPMFSSVREEGRVHVYINQGEAKLKEADFELVGSDSYAARFGETIMNLGDIDDDGYPDVAIGAAQEDDLHGAIYIYNGRKSGIAQSFSQRITGSLLGDNFRMFGQSVSGGVDVDSNNYPDVAVGAFLSDSAVVFRTRPVVKVDAVMLLPESLNRSIAQCTENGLPAVCVKVKVCFRVGGKQIPGNIELKYNITADVHHKDGFPSRFYFSGNGTSNVTAGRVKAKHEQLTCATHQAFMKKDIRDIFSPIHFEVKYKLGEHRVLQRDSGGLPSLKPILQQKDEYGNVVKNNTIFARHCSWENCSTNLQVSANLVLPQSYRNMPYFALGNGKSIMLNTTLVNIGDDAFLPKLYLRFPSNLHFIKVLEEDKYISCEIAEENKVAIGLDCNVGNLYIPPISKINITFLLDVMQNSSAGNLSIKINATSENFENTDLQHDNVAVLTLPLRYAVDLNVHGFVSPTSFLIGKQESVPVDCYPEKFNYTYKVMNIGPSKALDARVKIGLPLMLVPYKYQLIRITDLQTTLGHCFQRNNSVQIIDDCDIPEASFIQELVFFFSPKSKRIMFCGPEDKTCRMVECHFGDLEVGKEVTITMEVELNPRVLQMSPGRHAVMMIRGMIDLISPVKDADTILLQDDISARVSLEALYSNKPVMAVQIFLIVSSLIVGLMILALLVLALWKLGFFERKLKEEKFDQDSWDYVPKKESVS
ncbi:integrin alpha-4-like isoform X1 [Sinocyclocheilus grahami]|uniref:integrin alpha-4-like isoform X1 n=1 Tax=Sinocyclocheilus grahami TaxID=75366 RepID=UPI0007AD27DA|nr:PREDICTED: integrin alpha-4-like isoform X1 [Sinocyclocheilus grahami]